MLLDELYKILAKIPHGKVATYKLLAEKLGTGPRVVGNLLHRNEFPQTYPCHRVIKSDGTLADGYAFGGRLNQQALLAEEGIVFKRGKINLNKYLVSPDDLK